MVYNKDNQLISRRRLEKLALTSSILFLLWLWFSFLLSINLHAMKKEKKKKKETNKMSK